VFTRLAVVGREHLSAGRPGRAAEAFDEALGLWRGRVLTDLPDLAALEPERARLESMRVTVLEDRADAHLALARHSGMIEELEGLVVEHPFRERLWGQLMVALYRTGRQAEALAAFRRASHVLAEELGLEPGPWLSRLQEKILIHHPSLAQAPTAEFTPEGRLPEPRTSFVGRGQELTDLAACWRPGGWSRSPAHPDRANPSGDRSRRPGS
jgi:DNA-binding SARP family transcriptional activator